MKVGPIERGVPPPATDRRRAPRNPVSVALAALAPGESRVFELGEALTGAALAKLTYRALGKGAYRTAPTDDGKGVRVWRL